MALGGTLHIPERILVPETRLRMRPSAGLWDGCVGFFQILSIQMIMFCLLTGDSLKRGILEVY